jgi:transposase
MKETYMKPYSNDLRTRVIQAYRNKEGSMRQLAKRFLVSLYFIWTLIVQYRQSGKVDPKPHGGGQRPKLDGASLTILSDLVEETPDATLLELQKRLKEKVHVEVSVSTVARALDKLNLTRKKKFASDRTRHRKSTTTS